MIEIKFRVWIKISQQFATWEDICHKKNLHRLIDNPEYIIMQYTGIKDKDGVEIYEGDILEAFNILGEKEILPVVFVDGAFMGKRLEDEEFPYFYLFANKSFSKTYKVVGNIYENPELLKA